MKNLLLLGLLASVIVSSFGATTPTAPVLLRSAPTTVTPAKGERVVLWAVWAEAPMSDTVPSTVRPASFDIALNGENFSLFFGPSEGSTSLSTDATYPGGFEGRAGVLAPVWADSRGNYGVTVQLLNPWTPANTWDFALSTGTSRTLGYEDLHPTFYRFHFPDSVVSLDGVVDQIDAAGKVLSSGKYHAVRFGNSSNLTEYAKVSWTKDGQKLVRHDMFGGDTPDWFDIPAYSDADFGTYTMHVENSKGSLDVVFKVGTAPVQTSPSITTQPKATTTTAGSDATFSVSGSGTSLSYQWRFNGAAISGATGSTYTVKGATAANAGNYDCVISNSLGSVTSNAVALTVSNTQPPTGGSGRTIRTAPASGRLVNISSRAFVGTGDQLLIGGVVIAGGKAQILVRASGPALSTLGVTGVLAQPSVHVFKGSTVIGENTGWGTSPNAAQLPGLFAQLGAYGWTSGSKDSAVLLTLDAGAYTFHVTGADGGTGIALLEIYIVSGPGYLANLSSRGVSGSGDKVMISGFVTQGDTQVLVRGVGPALSDMGVSGALAAPQLEIYTGNTVTDTVNAWASTYDAGTMRNLFQKLGAFDLKTGSADSVDVVDLNGARTAMIKSTNSGTGIALAEVYLVLP